MQKFLYYLPRVLTSLVTLFFYLFVLEGLSPEFGWQSGVAHFLLASAVLLLTILAWKRPKIGGWPFLILGIFYFATTASKGYWQISLPLSLPMALSGMLFLAEGFRKK